MCGNLKKTAALLNALGNETRLRIFRILVQNSRKGITPTDISKTMNNMPRNTLSFHLNLMTSAGLCAAVKNGKQVFYKPNCSVIREMTKCLLADCCGEDFKC